MKRLNRTDREFLNHLDFRESGDQGRPCWVYWMPGDRWQLVVWTLMGTWERSPFIKRGGTLIRLQEAGLAASKASGRLPAPFQHHHGSMLALTDAGRAALGGAS